MKVLAYTENLEAYLQVSDVVDYDNETIQQLANTLYQKSENELDFIKLAYEYVRDQISHSADINEDVVTCKASEVLAAGHGICFAKSNLLTALLRYQKIPAGFCYQKLILDDDTAPELISLEKEQLAFPVRLEKGEVDDSVVYPTPDANVLESMKESKTRSELWKNLPIELAYHK